MQVVILAGGKGTRLRPLTYQTPKPMIPVQNKPFLLHQLEIVRSLEINQVLLLVSYLGEQIESYFGDGSKFGLKIEYSYEETSLGTGGALKNAENRLLDEFLLLNGDTLLPIDYGDLISHFNKFDKIGTVTAYNNTEKIVLNNIAVGISNMVVGYNKKDPKGMTHVDAGGMVFKKDLLDIIPEGCICSLEEEILSVLIKKKELAAFVSGERFYDIGSFKDLELVQRVLR